MVLNAIQCNAQTAIIQSLRKRHERMAQISNAVCNYLLREYMLTLWKCAAKVISPFLAFAVLVV